MSEYSNYPVTIKVHEDGSAQCCVERFAYGQVVEKGHVVEVLICEPIPGAQRATRYRLVGWCEQHQVGWKGAACPLCQLELAERMRTILAAEEGA